MALPLPPLKPMAQSWRGVTQVMEVQRLLVTVIPRFIHLHMPLLPLKPMGHPPPAMTVLIETTRAIFNNSRRVKLVLKDIEFIRRPYILIFYNLYSVSTEGGISQFY
jgi:hypothetical protein